jgi:anti-sigma factor RsiW
MSKCEEIAARLLRHGDKEPPPEEAREIESHLASCPACRAELESLRGAAKAAGEVPAVREERWNALWSRIEEQAARQQAARRLWNAVWSGAAVTAAAAAVLVAAYVFGPVGGEVETAAAAPPGFEVVSIDVESPDYAVTVMAASGDEMPVIWLEKI